MIIPTMDQSLAAVRQLVEDFKAQKAAYLSPQYQESQVRQDFIDKFFAALGWDVTHQRQKNPYEQEAKIENRVRAEGSQRFADYAFFIAPNYRDVKFFVEAKKPAHDLRNPTYYHQAIRYGWNQKTPVAILTDFEEFHILDCRYKPDIKTVLDRKIEVYRYTDYADEETFKKIFFLFGRDAVASGSLENYAGALPRPRGKAAKKGIAEGGYQQVDEAFLELLDGYRDTLAHAFKNKNAGLDGDALTEAVQRTLDRLVFVRFLEDKGIEDQTVINYRYNVSAWNAFLRHRAVLEPKYNGLVFKEHPVIDSPTFIPPDDGTFADICDELADPASPYDFNSIPISILGSIYERFLGKVVTTTDKRARVIEKPEVRKAGGVYYTPEYIVRYIVSETLGKLLQPPAGSEPGGGFLTPAEVARLRIADIACGSGSFLLEVYSQLLDYHTRYYTEHPEKAKKGDTETREGKIVLSHKKRQEILVNNIYGVDIDFQATEVTQLSLYLKLMEDVTMNDAFQFSLLKERMLPDLRRNIVCGNSLIGRDILDGKLFDDDTEHALKPMNFEDAFPEIMKNGGFDVVVGNPPYVRQELLSELKSYFQTKYSTFHGAADLYTYFIERGISLLRLGGIFSYIVANKWMRANYGAPLRKWLKEKFIDEIIDFGDLPVFQGATTYPCIIRINKEGQIKTNIRVTQIDSLDFIDLSSLVLKNSYIVDRSKLEDTGWSLSERSSQALLDKLKKIGTPLSKYVNGKVFYGIKTGLNEAFVISSETRQRLIAASNSCAQLIKPFLAGREVKRYGKPTETQYLILIPNGWTNQNAKGSSDRWKWFEINYPALAKHLAQYDIEAKKRYDQGEYWWELRPCDYYAEFERPKIIYPNICKHPEFTLDDTGLITRDF